MSRPARTVPILLALACVVAVAACGGVATPGGSPSASLVPTEGQALATATPVPADDGIEATPTAATIATPPAASTPAPTPAPSLVTVKGVVTAKFASGDFLLIAGPKSYTVALTSTTSVVNLDGHIVPVQFIQVADSVEVTGRSGGLTIEAQQVVVQTHKDF